MKTIYYIFLLLFTSVVVSCDDKNTFVLEGNIKGLQSPEIYIISGSDLQVDTVITKSGKFTYKGVSQEIEPLLIYMENGNVWITLWVQNGEKYSLKGDANYPELFMTKGGEINRLLSEFKNDNLTLIKEKCELRDKLLTRSDLLTESNMNNDTQISFQMKNVDRILASKAQDFVEANLSSIAALVMIQDYILDIENASDIHPYLSIVAEEIKNNPLYEKLQLLCLKDLQTKSGQPALNFSITDTKNDTISLETFKNKFLILTFATSQCEFCKPEYAELLSIQDNFPAKELAILTVSLDENKEDWKNLASENGINWTQVIDSTGWASEMASLYNVLTVPCNYLIDKNGTIVGSKLSVDSIQSILTEKLKIKN